MNRAIVIDYLSEIGIPGAADIVDELERRLDVARQNALVDLQRQLEAKAQAYANGYFSDDCPPPEEWRPAFVELAALTRETWAGIVKLPTGLAEDDLEEFASDLYNDWDGGDFTTPDAWFWEKGTCSAEYV